MERNLGITNSILDLVGETPLIKLITNWYIQVQDESMAPARMVDFMRNHVPTCPTCMADPLIEVEITICRQLKLWLNRQVVVSHQ